MLFPQLLGRSFQKAFRLFWFQQPGAQPWQKSWNFGVNLALDMLLVCSDIQVLGSPLMSVKVTKMQDLVGLYEFSQSFRGWYPEPPQREGAPSLAPIHSPACGQARGMRPGVGTQTLVSLNFSAVVAPLLYATGVSMGPPESWTQTVSRSLPNFLQG